MFRLADERKEEGNTLYKAKNYRDAIAKYSEAIGEDNYLLLCCTVLVLKLVWIRRFGIKCLPLFGDAESRLIFSRFTSVSNLVKLLYFNLLKAD